jgi:hypothetical protein
MRNVGQHERPPEEEKPLFTYSEQDLGLGSVEQ